MPIMFNGKHYTLPPVNLLLLLHAHYYCKREKQEDTHFALHAIRMVNGTTISKRDLNERKNNRECEETINLIMSLYYTS